jgi:UDP-glucose 4-epimerase
MKCLLLGGGGFLGSHLCEQLLAEGEAIRIFERPLFLGQSAPSAVGSTEWQEGDFNNVEDLERAVSGCNVIYHLVSTTIPKSSNENPVYDVETNLLGTLRLLDVARHHTVRKIVFVSSGGTVYGKPTEIPIKETHPTDPVCSYGIAKLAVEKYLYLYHQLYGLDYCVLRLGNPYGERQRVTGAQGAVAVFMHKAVLDEPIEIWGDGSVIRDYVYVKDAVRALSLARCNSSEHRIFNIGGGHGRSLHDLVSELEKITGRKLKRSYLPGRSFDVPVNVLDISRARDVLQWYPRVSFEEGLRRTWSWVVRQSYSGKDLPAALGA